MCVCNVLLVSRVEGDEKRFMNARAISSFVLIVDV